jgi:hypothetical protein
MNSTARPLVRSRTLLKKCGEGDGLVRADPLLRSFNPKPLLGAPYNVTRVGDPRKPLAIKRDRGLHI